MGGHRVYWSDADRSEKVIDIKCHIISQIRCMMRISLSGVEVVNGIALLHLITWECGTIMCISQSDSRTEIQILAQTDKQTEKQT